MADHRTSAGGPGQQGRGRGDFGVGGRDVNSLVCLRTLTTITT